MSYALQYSAHTLVWALLLLCFVMYFFATAFTQAATDHVASLEDGVEFDESYKLLDFYGTLPRSFYSLFLAVASGRDWWELVEPLAFLEWPFVALFIAFVSVTVFGVMNVVTSVFVESALQSTQHYKDLLIQESLKAKKMYMDHLLEVFHEIDADMSGSVTLEELEQFLLDPALRMYLESMDIQPDDARTLFRLLDKDDSGSVSIEEFCQGCLRLKGEAKSFDIHCIIFENHRVIHKWRDFMHYLEKGFGPALTKAVEQAFENRLGKIHAAGMVVDYGHLRSRAKEHTGSTTRPSVNTSNGTARAGEAEAGAGPSPFSEGKAECAWVVPAPSPPACGEDTGADDLMPNTPYKSSDSQ